MDSNLIRRWLFRSSPCEHGWNSESLIFYTKFVLFGKIATGTFAWHMLFIITGGLQLSTMFRAVTHRRLIRAFSHQVWLNTCRSYHHRCIFGDTTMKFSNWYRCGSIALLNWQLCSSLANEVTVHRGPAFQLRWADRLDGYAAHRGQQGTKEKKKEKKRGSHARDQHQCREPGIWEQQEEEGSNS